MADTESHGAVREFFELFKTPWEFFRGGRQYDVVICTGEPDLPSGSARLIVIYSSRELRWDHASNGSILASGDGSRWMRGRELAIPVYQRWATFESPGAAVLVDEVTGRPSACLSQQDDGAPVVRIGYDLFREIESLLTVGQPPENAAIPTLECHIALLRGLIVDQKIGLTEIPPVPKGYRFIACITHDVDHPAIRLHKFDHTMFGFLYRALIGSLTGALRGRVGVGTVIGNWAAALKLPLVYLGMAEDFWSRLDYYTALDRGPNSSFFVIPYRGRAGLADGKPAPAARASGYGAADIKFRLRQLAESGHEIGLHGIDAWRDPKKAREEAAELRKVSGAEVAGVRMHWLYFGKDSLEILDKAGFEYDSTVGYNEAVGYQAGTTQVYKPLQAARLLELPLHIMDTALFLSRRQNLSPRIARERVDAILDNAGRYGGVVTINWHDRSIAPERMWKEFYVALIASLVEKGAWLANAKDTVAWFQERRMATFEDGEWKLECDASRERNNDLPELSIKVHHAHERKGQYAS